MSDGSLTKRPARNRKFCEGWLEHKAHRQTGYRYEKLFALLEDNVIYIFSASPPSQETQIGNLTLDSSTVFTVRGGNASKGFKFDLNAGNRLNRFKTKKMTERELWRGYITGISKGYVPNNLDLLDSEITRIQHDIAAYHAGEICDYDPKQASISSGRSFLSKIDSGVVSLGGRSRLSSSSSEDARSRTSASAMSSASGTLNHGGPTMVHKFYNDHNREQEPPSWFIPHCSRETAEKLLERAVQMNYGNTLMRESTSHLSNGSYVISKLSINKRDDSVEFEHFEVIRTSGGYKVNVQNPHEPMKCLSDVMDYFMRTSGGSTHPLIVNDMKVLGQDTPGYATQITRVPEPWKWPPTDSRDEPVPDYDPPESPSRLSSNRGIDGSQTVSAGILRNRPLPSPGASERKSVGWSSVITTPPPAQSQTFAGSRRRQQEPVPSMVELAQRSKEADQIHEFDTMLSGFESGFDRNTIYVNDPANNQKVPACPAPPPPPPTAHIPERPRSYINVNADRADPDLDALPVAPPAPRIPIVSSTSSTSISRNSIASVSSAGLKHSTSSPVTSVKLRHSSSTASSMSNTAQSRHGVTKSSSENQLRNVRSPDSPKNFPAWSTPKRNTDVFNQTDKPEVVKETKVESEEPEAGIVDKTPGGVSTLRNRFESSSNASSSTPKHGHARSSLPLRWSLSSAVSQTMGELDDLYDYLSDDLRQSDNNNTNTNTTNKMHLKSSQSMIVSSNTHDGSLLAVSSSKSLKNMTGNITKSPDMTFDKRQRHPDNQDDHYDDTALPERNMEERRVQFQQRRQTSVPNVENNRLTSRRQTEPAISITNNQFEGLNPEFKKKLEGMIGGATMGPAAGKGSKPGAPHGRPTSSGADDHIYQELPEVIPPDGVFYANERYNVNHDNT